MDQTRTRAVAVKALQGHLFVRSPLDVHGEVMQRLDGKGNVSFNLKNPDLYF